MTGHSDVCRACGEALPAGHRGNQVFCDAKCHKAHLSREWAKQNPKSALGSFAAGTIAEANAMRVAIDLLAKGYGVYRAAFPAMPYDIILAPVNELYGWKRIKVVAGSKTPKGTIVFPRKPGHADALAVVLADGTIHYKPEL